MKNDIKELIGTIKEITGHCLSEEYKQSRINLIKKLSSVDGRQAMAEAINKSIKDGLHRDIAMNDAYYLIRSAFEFKGYDYITSTTYAQRIFKVLKEELELTEAFRKL
jgi:hypothetical protein